VPEAEVVKTGSLFLLIAKKQENYVKLKLISNRAILTLKGYSITMKNMKCVYTTHMAWKLLGVVRITLDGSK